VMNGGVEQTRYERDGKQGLAKKTRRFGKKKKDAKAY